MKALQFNEYGGPEVLALGRGRRAPSPGPGQVRIRSRPPASTRSTGRPAPAAGRRQAAGGRRATSASTRPAWSTRSARASTGVRSATTCSASGNGHPGRVRRPRPLGAQAVVGRLGVAAAAGVASRPPSARLRLLGVEPGRRCSSTAAPAASGAVAVQMAVARRRRPVIASAGEGNQDYLREIGAIPVLYGEGVADRVRAAAGGPVDAVLRRGRQDPDRGPDRAGSRAGQGRHDRQLRGAAKPARG